jgi:hypothetical protein
MATLTLRNVKGSQLTHTELDSNFLALDSDIAAINTTIAGGAVGADSVNSLIDNRIDSDTFVRITTDQTIGGIKTFSDSAVFSGAIIGDGSQLTGIESYDSAKVQGQMDSASVALTGDQTIAGVKTFSDSAVFSGAIIGDGSQLTGIESYDSAKVQGQMDSDFPTRELTELFNVNTPNVFGGDVLVYDSATSKWVAGSANARQEFHFTPNAGTTALSGNDKFGVLLQYIADSDQLDVFVNGNLLVDSDYTKTNNGTITLDVATSASDEVVIHKYRPFVVAGDDITDLNINDLVSVSVANPQDQQILLWDSSQQSWVAANTNVRSQYHYTPATGTTVISGSDKNGASLLYTTDDTLDVYINGVLLNEDDYVRNGSTNITLDFATDSGDDVRIIRVEPTRVGETQGQQNAEINVLIDARIDSDNFVRVTGNETVGGIKTFSDSAVFSSPVSIQGVTYPDSAGREGQLLTTHGDGSTSFDSVQTTAIHDVFWENSQLLTRSHTIATGRSAISAGPITLDTGVTTTLDSGARWVIM